MNEVSHQEIARCLFRESNDALFLFDPRDHSVVDLNPLAQRLTGLDRASAGAMRVWQLFSGGEGRGIDGLVNAYLETGYFHSREGFLLYRRGGDPLPVNLSVSRIHTEPTPLGLVVARDISERLRAQEELRASESRFRSLAESARVLILTLAPSGSMTSVNPEFEVITDWSRDEWLGRPFADLLHPDDRDPARDLFRHALAEGSAPLCLARLATKYAGYCDLEILSISRVTQGKTAGLSLIARDVTQARRAEAALRRAEESERDRQRAEIANRAKSEFLAQISHELRNPMAAIQGFTDLLLSNVYTAQAPPDYREGLEILRRNGLHLLGLLDDLLDLSRIESGRLRVHPAPASPGEVADDVVASLRTLAAAAGVVVAVEAPAPIPETIRTDRARLRQILMNLVGNAIKYGHGGDVTLRLRVRPGERERPTLLFEVIDSGPGFTPEALARVFVPFQHAEAAPGEPTHGAGLGLAISRHLTEILGGTLTAESAAGRGAIFTLALPVAPEGTARPARATRAASPLDNAPPGTTSGRLQGLRLLVAEDFEANRQVLTYRLTQDGALVTAVSDGLSAVASAARAHACGEPFDAILLDLQMPGADGFEVARRLQERGIHAPRLALTAYATEDDRREGLDRGFTAFISKPIDWEELVRLIAQHAGRSLG